jgi:hypothetical protein
MVFVSGVPDYTQTETNKIQRYQIPKQTKHVLDVLSIEYKPFTISEWALASRLHIEFNHGSTTMYSLRPTI